MNRIGATGGASDSNRWGGIGDSNRRVMAGVVNPPRQNRENSQFEGSPDPERWRPRFWPPPPNWGRRCPLPIGIIDTLCDLDSVQNNKKFDVVL
ncbi:hypothetical protein CRG98_034354 [Punica granatum]|uniref:Uncharacterized protein n=1 Tax=Punica granatum TaxID=22663 RepID=A0A2I0IMN9_PUNGR|nr:hypothetical protein CRG98_034354 [Punica granatum]